MNTVPRVSRSLASSLVDTGAKFAGINMASLAVATLAGILNARMLGPHLVGVWATASIVLAYLPFLPLGVDHAAARDIPLLSGAGRTDDAEEVKRVYFWFALLVACASAAVVAVAALVLHLDPLLSRSLLIVAVLGVLTSVGRWAIILLKADNQFSWAGSAEGCRSVGLLIATPLIYVLGLPGLWVGNLVGAAASTGLAWGRLRYRPRFRWNAVLLRRLIGFGVPIMLVSIAQIVSMTGDRILVLGFLGTSALGIYGIGRTFTQILMASGGIVGPVVYPRITERYGRTGDAASLQRLVVAPTLVLAATLPLTIGVAWFGLPVIVEWLLPAFRPGILPAQILFVATAAYLLAGASDYLLIALRRQVLSLLLYVGAVALGLLLEYGALRVGWGLAGVAGGVALSSSVYAVVIIMAAQHHCRVPPKAQIRNVVRGLLPLGLAVVLCVAIDHFAPSQGHTPLLRAGGWAGVKAVAVLLGCLPFSIPLLNREWPEWRAVVFRLLDPR